MPQRFALVRNFLWLALGEGIGRLLALGIVLYLARTLGADGFGLVGSAAALVMYFGFLVAGGSGYYGVREVARAPADVATALRTAGAAQLLCALGCYAILGAALLWTPLAPQGAVALVLVYSVSLLAAALNPEWALRGLQDMRTVAFGVVLSQAALGILVLALVRDATTPLPWVAGAQVAADAVLVAFYYVMIARRHPRPALALDWRRVLAALRATTRITLGRLPRLFYFQGDVLLLAWIATAATAGQFLASHRLVLTFIAIGALIRSSIYPRTSQVMLDSPAEAGRLQMQAVRNEWLVVAPAWVCCWVYADPVIALLFGDGYPQSAAVLRVTLLTVPIVGLGLALQDLLAIAHRDRVYLLANLGAMLLHVGLALALVGAHGAAGAAVASLAAQLAGTALLFAWRDRGILPARLVVPPLLVLAAAATMLAVMMMLGASTPVWIAVPLGALVYAAAALLLRAVRVDELRQLAAQLRTLAGARGRC